MAACSAITGVACQSQSGQSTVAVGTPFVVVGSFTSDGAGASCPQSMNWNANVNGGPPVGIPGGNEDPVLENVSYPKTYTPTKVGTHVLFTTLVYRTEEGGPAFQVASSLTYDSKVTLRVIRSEVAEIESDAHTEDVESDAASGDDSVTTDTATEAVPGDSFAEEIESDTHTEDIQRDV